MLGTTNPHDRNCLAAIDARVVIGSPTHCAATEVWSGTRYTANATVTGAGHLSGRGWVDSTCSASCVFLAGELGGHDSHFFLFTPIGTSEASERSGKKKLA